MSALPRFMIAAAHKSSGKTVVSTGLAAALTAEGDAIAGFKKGPDYIDPLWLGLATGRPVYNLDFNTMSAEELRQLFAAKAKGLSLIEANKGLFDGVAPDGSDSNAALAKLLGLPVILVVDTKGMTRGIAPLLMGYQSFDPDVQIAGVILNKTGGARHESKLRQAVEAYTDILVLGAIGASPNLDISERHLGLTTPAELGRTQDFIRQIGHHIANSVDLARLRQAAKSAPPAPTHRPAPAPAKGPALRIGIARDAAFSFYYEDDLEAFAQAGARLIPLDLLHDPALPDLDGLFIGGGFPETQMAALAANAPMRASIKTALENGLPAYAECGGLMYLTKSLTWRGETQPMVGFFDAETLMHPRPQGRGYVRFRSTDQALWPRHDAETRAHEFHYAQIKAPDGQPYARLVTRGFGTDGRRDGFVKANTQAGFIHLRHSAQTPWVTDFLDFVAKTKAQNARNPALAERGSA